MTTLHGHTQSYTSHDPGPHPRPPTPPLRTPASQQGGRVSAGSPWVCTAPDPLWGAGLPRPPAGGWGGARACARPLMGGRATPPPRGGLGRWSFDFQGKAPRVFKPAEASPKAEGSRGGGGSGMHAGGAVSHCVTQVCMFQGVCAAGGCRQPPTARADASRLRTLRSMPPYWFFFGSGARVRGAAWGSAHRRPGGAMAPKMAAQAAVVARARPAPARCLVLGRCRSPAPYCGSMASSATWSACRAKVPGQDALRTAMQGRGRVFWPHARAVALRRARPPRRREGLFVHEGEEREKPFQAGGLKPHSTFFTTATTAPATTPWS